MQIAAALPNGELNKRPQIRDVNCSFIKKVHAGANRNIGTRVPFPLIIEADLFMELLLPGSFK